MDVDDLDDVTLVAGAPRSGKTRFALDMLVAAMKRHGDAYAVMTVSGRQVADRLGDTVIRELSAISQARPVTTLPAVAFRIMTAVRSHAGQPLPKLLNGAEQDVVIRRVLARHAEHAEHGDECSACALLRTYFVVADWSGMVVDDATDAFANQPTNTARLTNDANDCACNGGSPSRCVPNTTRPSTRHIRTNTVSTPRSS